MIEPETVEVATDFVTGLVNMYKDARVLYWIITAYAILVGAAMTYVGRRHLKKLLFFVGVFTTYLPLHYFASEVVAVSTALIGGVVFVLAYLAYVFMVGVCVVAAIAVACGMREPNLAILLLGCVGGVVAVVFRKHIVIPATAMTGAFMLALGVAFLLTGINPWLFTALTALFAVSGIWVQYKFTAGNREKPVGVTAVPAPSHA